jgi:hypothetical protein
MLYAGRPPAQKGIPVVALALHAPDDAPELAIEGYSVAWSDVALTVFRDIWHDVAKNAGEVRELPYGSLRGLLEVFVPTLSQMERGVGLSSWNLKGERDARNSPAPFLWANGPGQPIRDATNRALQEWIPNYVVDFARPAMVAECHINKLFELYEACRLLTFSSHRSIILPWKWSPDTGTATYSSPQSFAGMVHFAARTLANTNVFPGMGAIRRIVTVQNGSDGLAELITEPVHIDGKGNFSFLLRLELVTFPGLHQPVLTISISKRRWLDSLRERRYVRGDVSGFMFPNKPSDRSPGFLLRRRRDRDGAYHWEPDNAFRALQRYFELPLGKLDGNAIASGKASNSACAVHLVHRYGVTDSRSLLKAGVPELDKLEAFEAVAKVLEPYGLHPLTELTRVPTRHRDRSPSRSAPIVNGAKVLRAIIGQWRSTGKNLRATTNESEISHILREQFDIDLASVRDADKLVGLDSEDNDSSDFLKSQIEANIAAVQRFYGHSKPQLVIIYDESQHQSLRLLEAAVTVLWSNSLNLKRQRLPKGTHGPQWSLPGANERLAERFKIRVEAWRPLADSIAASAVRTLCLVLASDSYPDVDGSHKLPDDPVNKPAARKALAALAKATVQYLLPCRPDRRGLLDLIEYLHRVQASLKDLISAHNGRIDDVASAVARCFPYSESAPREVIGLTIVRRNSGRGRAALEKTFLAVAIRVQVSTGLCEMRYAHERHGRFFSSSWQPFARALGEVADASPIQLAENFRERGTRFMKFCESVITESVESGAQPLILIDSSNCAKLWPWLTDSRVHASRIEIAERQWMQEDWSGARIVRIRQDLAPGIILDKILELAPEPKNDSGNELRRFRVPVSPGSGMLYRLNVPTVTGCVTYLSVGGKTLHQNKRGLSCYRTVLSPTRTGTAKGYSLYDVSERKPFTDQWPTPRPIEVVVTLRQPEDNPDRIAEFVEALRSGFGHYSEWTSLPGPLFFERVVRDYVSGFALDEEARQEDERQGQ